jgi:hypothetical protein
MRRTPLLVFSTLALTLIGALLTQSPARAGDHCRRHARYAAYVTRSCRTVAYRPAGYYLSERSYSRCERPRYSLYAEYRQGDRPRYTRYDRDDAYRRCDRPRYNVAYDRDYYRRGDRDCYEPRRSRRSGVEVLISLGAVLGGGHRHCR